MSRLLGCLALHVSERGRAGPDDFRVAGPCGRLCQRRDYLREKRTLSRGHYREREITSSEEVLEGEVL